MVDVEKFNQLKTRAIQVQSECKSKYMSAQNLKVQYDEIAAKLEAEKKSCITQSVSIDTLKEIMDRLSQEYLEKVVELLTYALSTIFYDKQYSVEIETSDLRNVKNAELYLIEKLENGQVIRSSFNDAIGGGVIAVCGLVLQIYYCNVLGQAPILFMDESLSQVSVEYTDTLVSFIKELAATKDVIVVLITHDQRYMKNSDKCYSVSEGEVTECQKQ